MAERALAAERAAAHELSLVPDWIWDGETLPVPIETIADSHYGMLVRDEQRLAAQVDLPVEVQISGLLFPLEREIWVDAEEAGRAPVRRRFTIGHELGHWVLHCSKGGRQEEVVHCRRETVREEAATPTIESDRPTPTGRPLYSPTEHEANQFSAALLMPRALVEHEHAWSDEAVWKLARAFRVSEEAMEWRLSFLEQLARMESG